MPRVNILPCPDPVKVTLPYLLPSSFALGGKFSRSVLAFTGWLKRYTSVFSGLSTAAKAAPIAATRQFYLVFVLVLVHVYKRSMNIL